MFDKLKDFFNPFWRAVRQARDAVAVVAKAEAPVLIKALEGTATALLVSLLDFLVSELARRFGLKAAAEELLLQIDKLRRLGLKLATGETPALPVPDTAAPPFTPVARNADMS